MNEPLTIEEAFAVRPVCDLAAAFQPMIAALEELAATTEETYEIIRRWRLTIEEDIRRFESSLTFAEMKLYLRLKDDHPEYGFYDLAVLVRPTD